ncbi:thioredoxin-disulfide reductase [Candidatus Parcubacteria bacterium]|jgi:thioredoxin reductase (NADPH)|nr:MAG: thioredoxin-disulfide reductase [Candidatus Parcubacteria bacterium]
MPHKLIIIGSGPAGLAAAIYGARAELRPLVISGSVPGGQLTETSAVENFPGFISIQGPELMQKIREHAAAFGTKFIDAQATKVDFKTRPFKIWVGEEALEAQAVIVATGAKAKWLGLANEQRLQGKGVSACATCDGFFFKNQSVVVVGGGDTAMEEANFLTKFASQVTIIHRSAEFRASKIMQERALKNPKIQVKYNSEVVDVLGQDRVEGVKIKNSQTGEVEDFPCQGLFLAIGHKPSTEIFEGQLELDHGYVKVHDLTKTSVEGVFAAGDVQDPRYRQAVTSAGTGVMALLDAEKYLAGLE